MNRKVQAARRSWRTLIVLPVILALQAGCGTTSDTPACCPAPASGTIQGTVDAPGDSVRWAVVAEGVFADHDRRESFRAPCDEEGAYTLDLPAGRYLLRTDFGERYYHRAAGPVRSPIEADTLTVEAGETVNQIDLVLGALKFDFTVPSAFNGLQWSVLLLDTAADPSRRVRYADSRAETRDGHCSGSFGSVPPRAYFIRARTYQASSRPSDFWMPFTRDPQEADTIRVQPGESVTYRATLDSPAARISGQIRGSWPHLGVGTPSVRLFNADSLEVASGDTDAFGAYQFALYAVDRVRVRIQVGPVSVWIGGASYDEATEFVLTPGEEIEVPDYVESAIVLTVAATLETEPPPLARIRVFDPTGRVAVKLSTRIGPPGRIAIPGLLGDTYRLLIEPYDQESTEWLPQWFDQALTPEESTPIVVPAGGEIVPVTMRLLIGGRIDGRVLDIQESPVTSFTIVLTAADRDTCLRIGRSHHTDGRFRLIGLPEGDYKLGITHRSLSERDSCSGSPSDSLIWHPGTASWDSATAIPIRGAQVVSGLEFRLPIHPAP